MTAKERLIKLQEGKSEYRNGRDLLSFLKADSTLLTEVKYLTRIYLHRQLTGCSSCAMDAYLELIHLTPTDMENLYQLKAGALLYDRETDKHYSNANLTDEVAEKLLKAEPIQARHFRLLPEDWEARIAGTQEGFDYLALAIDLLADPKATKKAVVDALKAKGAKAKEAEAVFVEAVKAAEASKVVPEVPEDNALQ